MSNNKDMDLLLKIWRQADAKSEGKLVDYNVTGISPDSSFLEMLDVLNVAFLGHHKTNPN